MNYCGRRSWLLVRIFKVFGMKLGAFMFLLGGSKYFSMWWLNFFNVYLNELICSSRVSHDDRRGRSQNLLSRDKCDERKITLFCFKIYHTFSLISKKGSIKLKLNNDLNWQLQHTGNRHSHLTAFALVYFFEFYSRIIEIFIRSNLKRKGFCW